VLDSGDPTGGKTAAPVPAKTRSAPKKGVGKEWFGPGIPADVCDDGAGVGQIIANGVMRPIFPGVTSIWWMPKCRDALLDW